MNEKIEKIEKCKHRNTTANESMFWCMGCDARLILDHRTGAFSAEKNKFGGYDTVHTFSEKSGPEVMSSLSDALSSAFGDPPYIQTVKKGYAGMLPPEIGTSVWRHFAGPVVAPKHVHKLVQALGRDAYVCSCDLELTGQELDQMNGSRPKYDSERNRLADECGRLKSENDELLRENAMLRRQVEKLERKR